MLGPDFSTGAVNLPEAVTAQRGEIRLVAAAAIPLRFHKIHALRRYREIRFS
jgi:hypothetical protein